MALRVVWAAGEGIWLTHLVARSVDEGEVEAGEVQGPTCLAAVELLGSAEVGQVLVVCAYLNLLCCTFQEVPPFL